MSSIHHPSTLDSKLLKKYPFERLVNPIVGMVSEVSSLHGGPTVPDFEIATAMLGNVTSIFPHVSPRSGLSALSEMIGGAGADLHPEMAWVRATVEAAERYSSMAFSEEDFLVESAMNLGSQAIDLDSIPLCSEIEYADPLCPLARPNKDLPLRWIKALSLIEDREVYVPAVMAHLYMHTWPGEKFWPMISTGTAGHTDLVKAAVSAVCEVIERDAIALTWLCRLPLPRIEFERDQKPDMARHLNRLFKSQVTQLFFDATTDLGIPTVYGLQLFNNGARVAQYVSCSTDFTKAAACAKTLRESAPARIAFRPDYKYPQDVNAFEDLFDGATYLSDRSRRRSFNFLLNSSARTSLGSGNDDTSLETPEAQLSFLTNSLRERSMNAYLVDLTSDELRSCGLWVVKAIIPGLVPMSVIHRARFLGHPRLYDYPLRAGYGSRTEADINPWPQPFA